MHINIYIIMLPATHCTLRQKRDVASVSDPQRGDLVAFSVLFGFLNTSVCSEKANKRMPTRIAGVPLFETCLIFPGARSLYTLLALQCYVIPVPAVITGIDYPAKGQVTQAYQVEHSFLVATTFVWSFTPTGQRSTILDLDPQ